MAPFRHCGVRSIYVGGGDGAPVLTTYKYMEPTTPGGPRGTVVSKDRALNALMDRMVINLVRYVQAFRHVRITKLVSEFCHDDNGRLWFVYTSEALTAQVPTVAVHHGKTATAGQSEAHVPSFLARCSLCWRC